MRSPTAAAMESAALSEARARIRELETEVKILRKAAAAVEAVVPPKSVCARWASSLTKESRSNAPATRSECPVPGSTRRAHALPRSALFDTPG